MDWIYNILTALGFNALAFSALVSIFCRKDPLFSGKDGYGKDSFAYRHHKLYSLAYWVLVFLSFPGVFIFEAVFDGHRKRVYDAHKKDLRSLYAITEKKERPSEWEKKKYGWEDEWFVDNYGNFDLQGWKAHEYEKLGL